MEESENKAPRTKRELLIERLRAVDPQADFADDEALFEYLGKDYEDKTSRLEGYETESRKLTDLFSRDPRSAGLLMSWKDGGDPIQYLIETFGDDFKEALDDPGKKEEFAESYQKWLDRVAGEKKLKQECDDNLKVSFETLEALQEEKGLTDDEALNIFNFVHQIILDGISNKISRETYDLAAKALHYDRDVADAARTGELRGRNARIEEKLRKAETPEALPPALGGTGGGEPRPAPKKYNPFVSDN